VTKELTAVISHPGLPSPVQIRGRGKGCRRWRRGHDVATVANGTNITASVEHQAGEFSVEPGLDRADPARRVVGPATQHPADHGGPMSWFSATSGTPTPHHPRRKQQ
jgi:hypothetical protein